MSKLTYFQPLAYLPAGAKVRLTQPQQCRTSGHLLPAGAIGRVVCYKPAVNKLMIDFGNATHFQGIDPEADAGLVEVVDLDL